MKNFVSVAAIQFPSKVLASSLLRHPHQSFAWMFYMELITVVWGKGIEIGIRPQGSRGGGWEWNVHTFSLLLILFCCKIPSVFRRGSPNTECDRLNSSELRKWYLCIACMHVFILLQLHLNMVLFKLSIHKCMLKSSLCIISKYVHTKCFKEVYNKHITEAVNNYELIKLISA